MSKPGRLRHILSEAETLKWYYAMLRGERPPTHMDDPQCGYFKTKLVRFGPYVPARIWLEQQVDEGGELAGEPVMRCHINGKRQEAKDRWPWLAGRPIPVAEYNAMMDRDFEQKTDDPAPDPMKPLDWSSKKPPF